MVDEQEATKGENETNPKEDTGDGAKQKATGLIDGAYQAAERAERAIEALKRENDRAEEIAAKRMLSGRAEAGSQPVEEKEQTPKQYSEDVIAGKYNEKSKE